MRPRTPSSKDPRKRLAILSLAVLALLASCAQVKVPNPRTNVRLAPAPYFDNKTGIYFPGALDMLYRQPVVDLEERSPGLGLAISYRHQRAKLDIFVYDLQASVIPTGIDSPVIRQSFEEALADLRKATDKRLYTNLQLHETGTVTLAGREFLHARFSYGEDMLLRDGHLLVCGVNGQIVKIRSSMGRPAAVDVWRTFGYLAQSIEQSRRNGYGGLRTAEMKRIESSLAEIDLGDGLNDREAIAIAQMEIVRQKRHNRYDTTSAEILRSHLQNRVRVRFSRYPTEPAIPVDSDLFVLVSSDGNAQLLEPKI